MSSSDELLLSGTLISPPLPSFSLLSCFYSQDLGAFTEVPFLAFPLGEIPQGWGVLMAFQRLFLIIDHRNGLGLSI